MPDGSGRGVPGYLGADPQSAMRLADRCDEYHILSDTLTAPYGLRALGRVLKHKLLPLQVSVADDTEYPTQEIMKGLQFSSA